MLINHERRLRRFQAYSDALICFAVEANYGGSNTASRVHELLMPNPRNVEEVMRHVQLCDGQSLGPIMAIHHDSKHQSRDPGVFTAEMQKRAGADQLGRLLTEQALFIAQDFVTQDPGGVAAFKAKFVDQLLSFRDNISEVTDPVFQTPKSSLSGKAGGKRDDLCVATQLCEFWRLRMLGVPSFRTECEKRGIPLPM
jgi:hypothetical protein